MPFVRLKDTLLRGLASRGPILRVGLGLFALLLVLLGGFVAFGWMSGSLAAVIAAAALGALGGAGVVYQLVLAPLEREYESAFELQASNQRALAQTDPVTGILSRRAITSSLLEAMALSERYRHPLSVVLVRIDRASGLKAELGRRGMVRLLQAIASKLDEVVRLPDRVGRYGDEEFLLVLPHTALKDAERIIERIRAGMGKLDLGAGKETPKLSLRTQATRYRRGDDLEQLISRLVRAKG